jgi:hypothetical protein
MRIAGILTLFVVASACVRAEEAAPPAPAAASATPTALAAPAPTPAAQAAATTPADAKPAKISPELAQQLTSVLPKYSPPPPVTEKPKPLDPDVLELPKMTIHKPRPRLKLTDDAVLTTKAFNEKLAKEKLGSFDRDVLNRFTLPLFGVSAEERAREEYERQKRAEIAQQVSDLAKVVEVVDPAQAKALRDAASKP